MKTIAIRAILLAGAAQCSAVQCFHAAAADIDEIVVTADRSGRAILDAPVFAYALDGQALIERGAFTANRLFDQVPQGELSPDFQRNSNLFSFRGLRTLPNGPTPFAYVVDGVQLPDIRLFPLDLYGVDSVVVTTGNHSPFFANATVGTITVSTAAPGDEFEAQGLAQAGTGGRVRLQGGAGGPVTPALGVRLDGFAESFDGLIENTFVRENVDFGDVAGARLRLVYAPRSNFTLDAQARFGAADAGTAAYSFLTNNNPNDVRAPSANRLGFTDGEEIAAVVDARLDLGAVGLMSVTGFNNLNSRNCQDLDYGNPVGSPAGAFGEGGAAGCSSLFINAYAQEFRVSFAPPRDGFFAGSDLGFDFDHVRVGFPALFRLDDGTLAAAEFFSDANPAPVFFTQDREDRTTIWAAYGRAAFNVTDRLTVEGALRLESQRVETSDGLAGFSQRETIFSAPRKVTVSYDAPGGVLLFASYGVGVRGPVANSALLPFGAEETARTVEAGFKTALLGGRLNVSATGYTMRVNDYQIFTLVDAAQFVRNFDRVRINGAEAAFDFAVSETLSLYGNSSFTDSKILDASLRPDLIGNNTPDTIRSSFTIGAAYRQPLGGGFVFVGNLDARRQGRRIFDGANLAARDPLFFLNARAGFERGGVGAFVRVENATDTDYYDTFVSSRDAGRANALGVRGAPRAYLFELTGRF